MPFLTISSMRVVRREKIDSEFVSLKFPIGEYASRFVEFRKAQQQGFVRSRLYRFLGDPRRYLVGNTYTDRETAMADQKLPAVQEYARAHPYSEYTSSPPAVEAYQIVARQGGAS